MKWILLKLCKKGISKGLQDQPKDECGKSEVGLGQEDLTTFLYVALPAQGVETQK